MPKPVRRYCRKVLSDGQPMIEAVHLRHTGTFNLSTTQEQWKPFDSNQLVVVQPPGFVWDACIRLAPAISAHVHDAYVQGQGILNGTLFGFLTVLKRPKTPELAQGELMRFLAETPWYPTVLLEHQGISWEPIDESRARATLLDGTTSISLTFCFDAQSLVSSVHSDGRYRQVGSRQVSTPWQGRFWSYRSHDGMLIPTQGEVAWLLPEGRRPYWRGHIQHIAYEYRLRD